MNKEEGSRIANKEEGSRMDVCGGCATKGDARQRHATTDNNQPAYERQMGGEVPVDKRRRGLDRPRLRV